MTDGFGEMARTSSSTGLWQLSDKQLTGRFATCDSGMNSMAIGMAISSIIRHRYTHTQLYLAREIR